MVKKSHLIAAMVVTVLLSITLSYAVSAAVPSGVLAPGTTQYAIVKQDTQLNVGTPVTWEPTGLSTSVTIPVGKTADVMVLLCATANPDSSFIKVRAKVGSALLVPNASGNGLNLAADYAGIDSRCENFFKGGVGAGTKTVQVQWYTPAATAHLYARSMIVILNVH
jgi:hypothetical protein